MIDLKGKACEGLSRAITDAGHWWRLHNNMPVTSDDDAVQAIIDAFNPLADQKAERITQIKADGLVRMHTVFPALQSLDEVSFYAEFWLSIAPAARSPTVAFKKIIDIYSAAKSAIASINACVTKAQIDAVSVGWPA